MQKAIVFIDSSNWIVGATQRLSIKKPWQQLLPFIENVSQGYDLLRTYYYSALIPEGFDAQKRAGQQKFLAWAGYKNDLEMRFGRYTKRDDEKWLEKGVDVFLAVDLVEMAFRNTYDVGIVISGDTDLEPAIQVAKNQGKRIIIYSYDGTASLRALSDRYEIITPSLFEKS